MPKFLPIVLLLIFCHEVKSQTPAFHFPANYLTYYIMEKPELQVIQNVVYWEGVPKLDSAIVHKTSFNEFSSQVFSPNQKVWFSITLFNSLPKLQDWILHLGDIEEAELHLVYENGIYQNFRLPLKKPDDLPSGSFDIAIPADEAVNIYFLASSAKPQIKLETPGHWLIRKKARQAEQQVYICLAIAVFLIILVLLIRLRRVNR